MLFLPWKQTSVYLHAQRPNSRLNGWHQNLQSRDLHLFFHLLYIISFPLTASKIAVFIAPCRKQSLHWHLSSLSPLSIVFQVSIRIPRNCNGYLFYFFHLLLKFAMTLKLNYLSFFFTEIIILFKSKTFSPTKMDLKTDFLPVNFQFFKGESCQILLTWKGLKIGFEKNFRTWKEHN